MKTADRVKVRRCSGFSLIEVLVTLLLFAVLVLLGLPALLNALNRAKITGFAQSVASLMQVARLEAVKRTTPVRVEMRFTTKDVIAYVDVDGDSAYTPGTDVLLGTATPPNGVDFHGPGAPATANLGAVSSSLLVVGVGGVAIFKSDGSVGSVDPSMVEGGFRFRDRRNNILEVHVGPQASARVAVRKFLCDPTDPSSPTYCNPDTAADVENQYFEADQGEWSKGTNWKWY